MDHPAKLIEPYLNLPVRTLFEHNQKPMPPRGREGCALPLDHPARILF